MPEVRKFFGLLRKRQFNANSLLCVGLDTEFAKIPACIREDSANHGDVTKIMLDFNSRLVKATAEFAGTIKMQSSFYEEQGPESVAAMQLTTEYIHNWDYSIPIIDDAKRMDIGNTNRAYTNSIFRYHGFDAVTVNPYLGREAAADVFIEEVDKGIIVLCRTSNEGAREYQDVRQLLNEDMLTELLNGPARQLDETCLLESPVVQQVDFTGLLHDDSGEIPSDFWGKLTTMPLYLLVALRTANHWNIYGNCAIVVGATYPEEGKVIRDVVGDLDFLVPGAGKKGQGGKIEAAVNACLNSQSHGMIINVSRDVTFAGDGKDFEDVAAEAARWYRDEINKYRKAA